MRNDYFDDLVDIPAVPDAFPPDREHSNARYDKAVPGVPAVPVEKQEGLTHDRPLAAKLRASGCPIAFEIDGEVVFWIVADDEAAAQADVSPCFTAAEAEVLAQFDAKGIHDLVSMKARFGGTITNGETNDNTC